MRMTRCDRGPLRREFQVEPVRTARASGYSGIRSGMEARGRRETPARLAEIRGRFRRFAAAEKGLVRPFALPIRIASVQGLHPATERHPACATAHPACDGFLRI